MPCNAPLERVADGEDRDPEGGLDLEEDRVRLGRRVHGACRAIRGASRRPLIAVKNLWIHTRKGSRNEKIYGLPAALRETKI